MFAKKKLGILVEVDSFIGDIIGHLSATYDIRAIRPRNMQDVNQIVQWADVVWFEFCNELLLAAINQNIKAMGKRVIARWHRFEIVESTFPQRMRFDYLDDLILVSHDMLRVLKQRVPQLEHQTRTHVLWNGVNLEKFKPTNTLDLKKIAWVAKPVLRKNQPMFLQIMHALVKKDPSYTLHVAGAQDEFVAMPYLRRTTEKLGLVENIFYYDWQRDMPAFLADKGVILSTSIHESFGYNIAEAMAVGALPVVHDYPGAEEFWPEAIRFSSIDEAVEKIMSGALHQWVNYVHEQFPLSRQMTQLDAIMDGPHGSLVPDTGPRAGKAGASEEGLAYAKGAAELALAEIAKRFSRETVPASDPQPAIMIAEKSSSTPVRPQKAVAPPVFDSNRYWEERYRQGGNSGAGSYNAVARYKALVINFLVRQRDLVDIVELGSGDGNQLRYFEFKNYTGFDVSETVIDKTRQMYAANPNFEFIWTKSPSLDWEIHEDNYDCALSLDVLYHLIDDTVFTEYLDRLFSLSSRYVVIYASNFDADDRNGAKHVRHRKFTDFIERRYPQWTLKKVIENPLKFIERTEADFFIYSLDDLEDMSFLDAVSQAQAALRAEQAAR
ncbi:glycosyltransferase involved in cell wall biosynthesis [Neorhizobium huautlense]|uniref:Glycosyltransferase involved in cell wall biosynthesis n=1 Tax=Neorhizobium huautlense TaxID=67774 RepID=A0ABT9PTG2_9HYPH|nr:glycosyltransferase [Neorhizobium huautlense]MDP9837767.1 glycosyltransferase involved in cell wall biosynthesis [Neorhizobium huautlense]